MARRLLPFIGCSSGASSGRRRVQPAKCCAQKVGYVFPVRNPPGTSPLIWRPALQRDDSGSAAARYPDPDGTLCWRAAFVKALSA